MSEYVVISSEKDMDEGGIIIHRVNVSGKEPEVIKYRAIQGGLTWPKDGAPGYYIILGQLDDGLAYHRQDVKSRVLSANLSRRKKMQFFLREGCHGAYGAWHSRFKIDY